MTSSHCIHIFIGTNYCVLKLLVFYQRDAEKLKSKDKQKLVSHFLPEFNCDDSNEYNPASDYSPPGSISSQLNAF